LYVNVVLLLVVALFNAGPELSNALQVGVKGVSVGLFLARYAALTYECVSKSVVVVVVEEN